ncbi:hypothetical protein CGCSCA5_v003404 [Colletotrichum siamense]|nr:hypothetical protein CGCSCA5_v003404 [Colletotrichum siamense]
MSDPLIYHVGWICAIPTEFEAALAFLDETHELPSTISKNDHGYALGRVGIHNVAIAVLSIGEYGLASAAVVAEDMLHHFPNIRLSLMVGIAGGAPSLKHDIRLGDVVVGSPRSGRGCFVQYDLGMTTLAQRFVQTGFINQLPKAVSMAVSGLEASNMIEGHRLDGNIKESLERSPQLQTKYSRPPPSADKLYKSHIIHTGISGESCGEACGNDPSHLALRHEQGRYGDSPVIHYGLIGSSSQLMRDARTRDWLAADEDILCFEMGAAGLMNDFPCLVVRGICDYADSHKSKEWQGYAAMAAAAYASDLLRQIPLNNMKAERIITDVLYDMENVPNHIKPAQVELVKKWLSPTNASSKFNHAGTIQHNGTHAWFRDSPAFNRWKSEDNQLLWIRGHSGSKNTAIVDTIQRYILQIVNPSCTILSYKFNSTSKKNASSVFRSLACQLYTQQEPARKAIYASHDNGRKQPATDTLSRGLQTMLPKGAPIVLFIDALDECEHQGDFLETLISFFSSLHLHNVKIVAVSQPKRESELTIRKRLGESNFVSLEPENAQTAFTESSSSRGSQISSQASGKISVSTKPSSPEEDNSVIVETYTTKQIAKSFYSHKQIESCGDDIKDDIISLASGPEDLRSQDESHSTRWKTRPLI